MLRRTQGVVKIIFSDLDVEEIVEGLEKAKGFIRRKLSRNINLRRTTEIYFKQESIQQI